MPIKIAGYGMNGPKFQLYLFNDTIVITASILAYAFQPGLICCWSVWRYIIIIIRCTCNSYSIILRYNSTHRLALHEYGIFLYFQYSYHPLSCSLFIWCQKMQTGFIVSIYNHEDRDPHALLEDCFLVVHRC